MLLINFSTIKKQNDQDYLLGSHCLSSIPLHVPTLCPGTPKQESPRFEEANEEQNSQYSTLEIQIVGFFH